MHWGSEKQPLLYQTTKFLRRPRRTVLQYHHQIHWILILTDLLTHSYLVDFHEMDSHLFLFIQLSFCADIISFISIYSKLGIFCCIIYLGKNTSHTVRFERDAFLASWQNVQCLIPKEMIYQVDQIKMEQKIFLYNVQCLIIKRQEIVQGYKHQSIVYIDFKECTTWMQLKLK